MHAVVVLLALLAAFCMAVGMVTQHRATTDVPTEKGMTSEIAVAMARSPLWWAGMLTTTLGYGFQVLALAWGSLLVVQPLLVSCLLFALPMSARLGQRRVTTSEWTWALVLTGALGVFILLARPKPDNRPPMLTWTPWGSCCCRFYAYASLWPRVAANGDVRHCCQSWWQS